MGEKEKVYLTAEQARNLTLTSVALKNYIYRNIKECAKEGRNTLTWDFDEVDPAVRMRIVKDLETDGYRVEDNPFDELDDESNVIYSRISW